MLNASVIISTRNRAQILPRLFDALAGMRLTADVRWELLLIDNGSTDDTAQVIADEISTGRLPLQMLSEPIPGKSRALNRAIREARGKLLVFTDDDVEPSPAWLQAYIDAAAQHPEIDGFAGKVLPKWLGKIPDWLHTEGPFSLPRGITNTRDFGDNESLLANDVIPGGVNTALRSAAAARNGWFREDLGPGTTIPFTEDTDYMRRYREGGGTFWYVPNALLFHCNVPERMTKGYVRHWMYEVARCQVLAFGKKPAGKCLAGVPLYLWRQWIARGLRSCLEPRPDQRLQLQMKRCFTAGEICGYRQLQAFRDR
ncbi:glycosyltransferase [Methylomonas sp. SURF-1]|uniref:Glycosyltransferase n=1 Tax=Methylomonas aurea TaxID=2952224 RepID=A0ABT1UGU3_9GAMM|nr:glycosyltransferase family 2 protein [Methylomonas sp. SURF-1]MCQ8181440.1 glycosyltransferase [Methylomonas sp. SURF-1]